jgi:hypothetical protein
VTVTALVAASAAGASNNNLPSKASAVKIGVPFTGVWLGTPYSISNQGVHWWRLPSVVRPGDILQIALDARQSGAAVNLCLISPVDDFGADDAFSNCNGYDDVSAGNQDRLFMSYEGASGIAYLVTYGGCCTYPDEPYGAGDGQYTATIEQITTLVSIGLSIPPALPPTFTLVGNLVYGDNTPAADGIPAYLQWRFVAPRGSEPEPFTNLIVATSLGGAVTFTGSVPTPAEGRKIQLRACVAQPGGNTTNCAESVRTTISASACTLALNSRLVKSRNVRRLKKRLRRAHRFAAKRKIRRKLKQQKRRLAKARRSVQTHCA